MAKLEKRLAKLQEPQIVTLDQVGHPRMTGGVANDVRSPTQHLPAVPGPAAGAVDHAGAERAVERPRGGPAIGDLRKTYYQWELRAPLFAMPQRFHHRRPIALSPLACRRGDYTR